MHLARRIGSVHCMMFTDLLPSCTHGQTFGAGQLDLTARLFRGNRNVTKLIGSILLTRIDCIYFFPSVAPVRFGQHYVVVAN